MDKYYNDTLYYRIVKDILLDNEFKKIDKCIHHGLSRFDHSCRVSYYSYKITKALKLNYVDTARAGLLHDFFLSENNTSKEKIKSMFVHSKKSLENSEELFYLSDREKDIIYTHMFPLNINRVPKYLESWIVSIVDKVVATYEFNLTLKNKCKLRYRNAMVVLLVFIGRIFN